MEPFWGGFYIWDGNGSFRSSMDRLIQSTANLSWRLWAWSFFVAVVTSPAACEAPPPTSATPKHSRFKMISAPQNDTNWTSQQLFNHQDRKIVTNALISLSPDTSTAKTECEMSRWRLSPKGDHLTGQASTFLGVPIIRTIKFWGSILGSHCFGKLPNNIGFKP